MDAWIPHNWTMQITRYWDTRNKIRCLNKGDDIDLPPQRMKARVAYAIMMQAVNLEIFLQCKKNPAPFYFEHNYDSIIPSLNEFTPEGFCKHVDVKCLKDTRNSLGSTSDLSRVCGSLTSGRWPIKTWSASGEFEQWQIIYQCFVSYCIIWKCSEVKNGLCQGHPVQAFRDNLSPDPFLKNTTPTTNKMHTLHPQINTTWFNVCKTRLTYESRPQI